MPANKNALIRYKTIDNCLRNRYRRWTLDDLVTTLWTLAVRPCTTWRGSPRESAPGQYRWIYRS